MAPDHYLGQVLDEKYRLERLLGRGGMGAVYLATHMGTERYVALKLITPQFMRNEEFVARFKREARAAGRLRHPNVVDVTDFGFAHARGQPVAYLVMEYLDGCTLGDVLVEEKRLPLEWVVDILEQVCSAVHEAHQQGIVHRDLKPDNIWLEPNRLGGYRVKVLDFGIAKLAEADPTDATSSSAVAPAQLSPSAALYSSGKAGRSMKTGQSASRQAADSEIDTLLFSPRHDEKLLAEPGAQGTADNLRALEDQDTRMFAPSPTNSDAVSTALPSGGTHVPDDGDPTLLFDHEARRTAIAQGTTLRSNTTRGAELTRVGAIMGTPLYMSPEQCAAKTLDSRSDIYSLGVIAYQMLAGDPPFAGETGGVMREHIEVIPTPLRERAKKVPKRVSQVVMDALEKNPDDRPQTAAAFASSLRAQADGIGSLYRRAFALYSEHFPTFLKLSLIAHIPVIVVTLMMVVLTLAEDSLTSRGLAMKVVFFCVLALLALLEVVAYFVAAAVISGMTAVIVTQLTAAPLRPVELRTAFAVFKRRWRPFLKTTLLMTLRLVIGFILFVIPGIVIYVRYLLYAPVVLIDGLEGKAARQRARALASRSWRTIIIVSLLQFLIPLAVSSLVGRFSFGVNHSSQATHDVSVSRDVYKQLSGLFNIFIIPLMSIVPALLYLKMRQLGGETLTDALAQIEEVDTKLSDWQRRMRTRLSLHTPRTNTPRT